MSQFLELGINVSSITLDINKLVTLLSCHVVVNVQSRGSYIITHLFFCFLLMLNNVSRIWFYYNGKWRRIIQFFSTRNHHLLPYQNKIGNVSFLFPLYLISMCNTKQRNICLFNIIHYLIILKMLISNSKWWHFVTRYNGNDNFVPYDRKEYETKL